MNSAQSYFLISLLLITALIAIICLLILATDQPDAMIEGQRRIVLSPKIHHPPPPSPSLLPFTTIPQMPSNGSNDESAALAPLSQQFPLEIPLDNIAEFVPSNGAKFMALSIVIDRNLREMLFLAKDDGQIEIRRLEDGANGTAAFFQIVRAPKLPIRIYRLRPINASMVVLLDATFSRLQLWDIEKGELKAEELLRQPVKDIALEGDKVFALGRFEDRIDAFDLSTVGFIKPVGSSPIRLGEHCQSLAPAGQSSLLVACPSGLVQISTKDGQLMRRFNQTEGASISAMQALSGPNGNFVLAASRMRREMQMLDWSGQVRARMHVGREEKGLWLWTGLSMYGDKLYALEYIKNRVEVFKVPSNTVV